MNNDTKSNGSTPTVSKDELPWKECVAGCVVPEDKEVTSLNCIHSVCSDDCLAKLKADSFGEGLKLFCGVCNVEVELEDLDRRITPSEIFAKKSSPEEIVINCGNCVLELPVVGFCYDCNIGLCQACSLHHPTVKLTQHHKIEKDLDQVRTKQFADLQKCSNHKDRNKSHHCFACSETMCEICVEKHAGHKIYKLQEAYNEIEKTATVLRNLKIKSQSANQDVQEKSNELKTQWENVNNIMKVKTIQIVKDLFAQDRILSKYATDKFLKKSCSLKAYSKLIENATGRCNRYLKVCETLVNNKDMEPAVKFLEHHRPIINELKKLDKEFEQDYNTFVEKDWHFSVNYSRDGRGQIEYAYKPEQKVPYGGESSQNATSSDNAVPSNSTSAGILNTNNDTVARATRLKGGRFAVNGTGVSQLSVMKRRGNCTNGVSNIAKVDSGAEPSKLRASLSVREAKTNGKLPVKKGL
ncbi:unnamed protein product [Orchesella dallaii]